MEISPDVQQEVNERIAASEPERQETLTYLRQGNVLDADTPERVEKRKVRLLADQSLAPILGERNRALLASAPVSAAPKEARASLEAQIAGKDTQPCWFLTRGAEVRRTVGRIYVRDSNRRLAWGTGFLVAPNLLLTNYHVLSSLEIARNSRVEFDYEETFAGDILLSAIFDLVPDEFFVSSPVKDGMDYALVAVASKARAESRRADAMLSEFGFNALVRDEGKVIKGELINAIHHPEGQPRQVSLRENRLVALPDQWLHYQTDTEQGSSGAPLYNNQWEVVGIHHGGVEKRDANNHILAIGGGIWTEAMGERKKWWDANEGLRISRFIADAEAQVKAALDPDTPQVPERIVSEKGAALFEALLRPSLGTASPITPTIVTPEHLLPPPKRVFKPE